MLWEVDIYPARGQPDLAAEAMADEAHDLGLESLQLLTGRGYLIEGQLDRSQVQQIAEQLLADRVVETTVVAEVGAAALREPPRKNMRAVHVLPKPGVMDPVAESARTAIADLEIEVEAVRTLKKYWLPELPPAQLDLVSKKLLGQ